MPEMPEVQTVVDDLKDVGLVGMTIDAVQVYWPKTIAAPDVDQFCTEIKGRRITAIRRRAKYIIFDLSPALHLLVHLRMTGRFHIRPQAEPRSKHEHVVFQLDDGRQLRFYDTRKFGRLTLTATPQSILGHLGPEPLSRNFSARILAHMLKSKNRILKPLLLDQSFIAGLGNIYVDEALWAARIHPLRKSADLEPAEVRALHRSIRKVLRRGLANLGTSLGDGRTNFYSVARRRGRNSDQLQVFRRTDEPCPRCNTPVHRILVGQRSTHICPDCQYLA